MYEQPKGFEEMIDAARAERWDFVDEHIGEFADNPEVFAWAAGGGLEDADGNIRDLAASILEKSTKSLEPRTRGKLLSLIDGDPNIYVQFRSSFALYVRGYRLEKVVLKLREASKDPATENIAKGYLAER